MVEKHRKTNMYFSAIGFIYDVKKGPFWEHSPTLYDISGIRAGWGKVNKVLSIKFSKSLDTHSVQGMVKMYNAEVLSKLPVVQHFPFGSLFSWDRDPQAVELPSSIHTSSQPIRNDTGSVSISSASMRHSLPHNGRSPWAKPPPRGKMTSREAGLGQPISLGVEGAASRSNHVPISGQDTRSTHAFRSPTDDSDSGMTSLPQPTRAPWAK